MSEQTDPEALREWMVGFLVEHTRDNDAYHLILERDAPRYGESIPLDGPELDRAELFRELVTSLVSILDSEEEAGKWLNRSLFFADGGESAPIDYLRDGGFWALSLLKNIEAPNFTSRFGRSSELQRW